jgi:hypothetical protein
VGELILSGQSPLLSTIIDPFWGLLGIWFLRTKSLNFFPVVDAVGSDWIFVSI